MGILNPRRFFWPLGSLQPGVFSPPPSLPIWPHSGGAGVSPPSLSHSDQGCSQASLPSPGGGVLEHSRWGWNLESPPPRTHTPDRLKQTPPLKAGAPAAGISHGAGIQAGGQAHSSFPLLSASRDTWTHLDAACPAEPAVPPGLLLRPLLPSVCACRPQNPSFPLPGSWPASEGPRGFSSSSGLGTRVLVCPLPLQL